MTTRLRLVCHASTDAVRASAFPDDEPLDATAIKKLSAFRYSLSPADSAWTSPALRARQTAEALQLHAANEPELRECDYGRWTGSTVDDVQTNEPDALSAWLNDPDAAPHGGESVADLLRRVARWLDTIGGAGGRVVAVTHASVIRAAILHAIGAPARSFWRIDVAPLSLARLSFSHGHWTLASIGAIAEPNAPPQDTPPSPPDRCAAPPPLRLP